MLQQNQGRDAHTKVPVPALPMCCTSTAPRCDAHLSFTLCQGVLLPAAWPADQLMVQLSALGDFLGLCPEKGAQGKPCVLYTEPHTILEAVKDPSDHRVQHC